MATPTTPAMHNATHRVATGLIIGANGQRPAQPRSGSSASPGCRFNAIMIRGVLGRARALSVGNPLGYPLRRVSYPARRVLDLLPLIAYPLSFSFFFFDAGHTSLCTGQSFTWHSREQ